MDFGALGLRDGLVRALAKRGYEAPTPVQLAVIPAVLDGRDVWASARTGSGKTAAFVLPILDRLAQEERAKGSIGALIVVPTRELATQIAGEVRDFSQSLPVRLKTVVAGGGVSINPQMMALRGGTDVVVATPGRLLDLVAKNALSLGSVATVVLDEADRLLAQGFAEELTRILDLLPLHRQTLLFSATFPDAVGAFARSVLVDPVRVDVESSAAERAEITERAIEVDFSKRLPLLRHVLTETSAERVLVFVATTHATEHVSEKLRRHSIDAAALHGSLSQGARTSVLDRFRRGKLRVLVATDLASRGLDIDALAVVINYDLPRSSADYVHRIGRTGRAGDTGSAISFVTAENEAHFQLIEKRHGVAVARERIPGFEPVDIPPPVAPTTGGVKGKRKSKKDKLREAAARTR
ncbi:DEAD/DEAH box helicase [soil metagenome]